MVRPVRVVVLFVLVAVLLGLTAALTAAVVVLSGKGGAAASVGPLGAELRPRGGESSDLCPFSPSLSSGKS